MKIILQTPERLILRHQDVIFGFLLALVTLGGAGFFISLIPYGEDAGWPGALFFIFLFICSIFIAMSKTVFVADRATQTITRTDIGVWSRKTVVYPIANVGDAFIRSVQRRSDGLDRTEFQPFLRLTSSIDEDDLEISFSLREKHDAQRLVDAINDWLAMNAP